MVEYGSAVYQDRGYTARPEETPKSKYEQGFSSANPILNTNPNFPTVSNPYATGGTTAPSSHHGSGGGSSSTQSQVAPPEQPITPPPAPVYQSSMSNITPVMSNPAVADQARIQAEADKLSSQGYSNLYYSPSGQGYSIAPSVVEQQNYLSGFKGTTFINSSGQGFSQNPDTVPIGFSANPYRPSETTFASGRIEQGVPMTNLYDRGYIAQDSTSADNSTQQFFADYGVIERSAKIKSDVMSLPFNPLMYVGRGVNTFKTAVGLGLATTLEFSANMQGKSYQPQQLKAIEGFGRNVFDVAKIGTVSYAGGAVFGGTVASYPAIKGVVTSKAFIFGSGAVTGGMIGAGYSKAENKGLFVAETIAGFAGGIAGYKRGYARYDPLNPQMSYSRTKLTYNERETVTRLKTQRLIETNKDYVSSKRVGMIDVTTETTPGTLKFVNKIYGRATGQRSTFVYDTGGYGIIERYSTPRIFGGRQQVVREFTPIEANNPRQLAYDFKAYGFKGKGQAIYPIASGIVTYPKPFIRVSKIPTFERASQSFKSTELDIYKGDKRYTSNSNLDVYKSKVIDLNRVEDTIRVTGGSKRGASKSYYNTVVDEPPNVRRLSKFSFYETKSVNIKEVGSGTVRTIQTTTQQISLPKPYTRIVATEFGSQITLKSSTSKVDFMSTVDGRFTINKFGNKIYIDQSMIKGGKLLEFKNPSQLSETVIKTDLKITGNPLGSLNAGTGKYYPDASYYNINKPSTLSKLFSSKTGSASLVFPESVLKSRSQPLVIQTPLKTFGRVSTNSLDLSNVYSVQAPKVSNTLFSYPSTSLKIGTSNIFSYPSTSLKIGTSNIYGVRETNILGTELFNRADTKVYTRVGPSITSRTDLKIDTKMDTSLRIQQDTRQQLRTELVQQTQMQLLQDTRQQLRTELVQQTQMQQMTRRQQVYSRNFKGVSLLTPPTPIVIPKLPRLLVGRNNAKSSKRLKFDGFNLGKRDSKVYILPDLQSVSMTEQKLFSAGKSDFEARVPLATPKIRELSLKAYKGYGSGFVPTEQMRLKLRL